MAELTTVSAVKTYLGISGSTFDALLGTMLDAAENAMRLRYNRPDGWTQAVFTEKFDGELWPSVTIKNTPVDTTYASQSLTIDTVAVDSDDYIVDAAAGVFSLEASTLQRYLGVTGWSSPPGVYPRVQRYPVPNMGTGYRTVTVVYKGGYSSIPSALAFAAQVLTGYYFNTRGTAGVQSQTLGQHSYTLTDAKDGAAGVWAQVDAIAGGYARAVLV